LLSWEAKKDEGIFESRRHLVSCLCNHSAPAIAAVGAAAQVDGMAAQRLSHEARQIAEGKRTMPETPPLKAFWHPG
jgi:hypothetical protein